MLIRFIGDVHGKYKQYHRLIRDVPASIQLGDMGYGFRRRDGRFFCNPSFDKMSRGNHRFIRGNHDNPGVCRYQKYWIPDGTVENGIMFIGGAFSVDRAWRTQDYDWWQDEELSYVSLWKLMDLYQEKKPRMMVTHDCPWFFYNNLHSYKRFGTASRTAQAFEEMWQIHKPEIWLFGHHHKSFEENIEGTRFKCLAELEHLDMEIPDA